MDQPPNTLNMDEPHPGHSTGEVDFKNTQIAFANKSDKALKRTEWVFKLMNNKTLVSLLSFLGLWAVKLRLPFADFAIKKTIFPQFCGGENLLDCQIAIDKLYKENALTLLDYGAEGKSKEAELDKVTEENIKGIEMAAANNSVPGISVKLTGLVINEILEKLDEGKVLTPGEQTNYDKFYERLNTICSRANELGVGVFIDAEESWIQKTIDALSLEMMELYNKEKVIVFNTYQLYRHDKLAQLKIDFEDIKDKGALFGAKLVRGAYMKKENDRAEDLGYPTPIQPSKSATDKDFNESLLFCLERYETLSFVCASHNMESSMILADKVKEMGLDATHPHINFCQLYGMSDNMTFNLAKAGYNVAKYVPYGPVKEVIPYLIRRAQENSSVTGEMGRELTLVKTEVERRGL
jgi:proline dehydrogenase